MIEYIYNIVDNPCMGFYVDRHRKGGSSYECEYLRDDGTWHGCMMGDNGTYFKTREEAQKYFDGLSDQKRYNQGFKEGLLSFAEHLDSRAVEEFLEKNDDAALLYRSLAGVARNKANNSDSPSI